MSGQWPERVSAAAAVLADLDGCLASANVPLRGAVELAEQLGERLFIVSNNSTHTPQCLAAELARNGLSLPAERILLAGALAVDSLAQERPGARILLAGSAAIASRAEAAGLQLVEEGAEAVLLTRDTAFDYRKLQRMAAALAGGAQLYAANPDLTHPRPDGRPVPETGALLAALRACAPAELPCRVFGKPEPALYLEALRRAGRTPSEVLMIGDNPTTDIAGASALGIPTILVGASPLAQVGGVYALLR